MIPHSYLSLSVAVQRCERIAMGCYMKAKLYVMEHKIWSQCLIRHPGPASSNDMEKSKIPFLNCDMRGSSIIIPPHAHHVLARRVMVTSTTRTQHTPKHTSIRLKTQLTFHTLLCSPYTS